MTIAQINDAFRKNAIDAILATKKVNPYQVFITPGIVEIIAKDGFTVLEKVRDYTDFNPDNNPHLENDFGAFTILDEKVFWKIDYYNQTFDSWSDPLSQDTRRVLTIMLASEY